MSAFVHHHPLLVAYVAGLLTPACILAAGVAVWCFTVGCGGRSPFSRRP